MPSRWHLYLSTRHSSPRTVVLFLQLRQRPRTPLPRPSLLSVVRFSPQISRQSYSRASKINTLEARWASSRLRRSYFFQQIWIRVLYEELCACQRAKCGGRVTCCPSRALIAPSTSLSLRSC